MGEYNYEQDYQKCKAELEIAENTMRLNQNEILRLRGLVSDRYDIYMRPASDILQGERNRLRDFCVRYGYFTCGGNAVYERFFTAFENNASLHDLAVMIWINSDKPGDASECVDAIEFIRDQLHEFMHNDVVAVEAAKASYENHPVLVDRIIEVSKWSPVICCAVTPENCVILESSGGDEDADWVAFQAGGLGFTIDFDLHIASRNTDYDA